MAKNWISSPLGIKILMDLYGKGLKKDFNAYSNISKVLNSKEHFTINNKLFLLSSNEKCMMLVRKKLNVQIATFDSRQEFVIGVKNWVQQYGRFKQLTPEKSINSPALLTNVCMYKGTWKNNKKNLVTIYNSFGYTEDVKYEARNSIDGTTATQYGEIKTDESGVKVKVLTCIPVDDEELSVDYMIPPISSKCFNFAIVYKDLPLFTGQVLP